MPIATLLAKEKIASGSLTSIVDKALQRKPPLPEYSLQLNPTCVDIVLLSRKSATPSSGAQSKCSPTHQAADEGFESDIDSSSIVSSDGSYISACVVDEIKPRETDSANGSAGSDSDTEPAVSVPKRNESFPLVDVVCYTDVKVPKLLLLVIKSEVLVFEFNNLDQLNRFYTDFSALKAVTNHKTLKTLGRFNLLHRTDQNGVTHIEVCREPGNARVVLPAPSEPSNIISINTPEVRLDSKSNPEVGFSTNKKTKVEKKKTEAKSSLEYKTQTLNLGDRPKLHKIWNSAEDLLEPKRPDRKKKSKGKAPQPPEVVVDNPIPKESENGNILKGQYVRVSVDPKKQERSEAKPLGDAPWRLVPQPVEPLFLTTARPEKPKPKTKHELSLSTFDPEANLLKYPEPGTYYRYPETTLQRNRQNSEWTGSVPRFLKARSRSETRNFTPMAYRYIDAQNQNNYVTNSSTMSNRLFGLSQKLKEFGSNVVNNNNNGFSYDKRRNSIGEMTYKLGSDNLKSVIKKSEDKKKNEKKVTFSAYTTVQVL